MEIFGEIFCEKKFFYLFGVPNFSEENIKALEQVLLKNYSTDNRVSTPFFLDFISSPFGISKSSKNH